MRILKNILTILVILLMLGNMAYAFEEAYNPRALPKDINTNNPTYPSFNSVEYAPWIRQFALSNSYEKENNITAGEGWQALLNFQIAPSNADVIYVSSDTAPLWKTLNGGKNWFRVNAPMTGKYGRGLKVDKNDHNLLYILTGPNDGFYRTKDGGITWEVIKKDSADPILGRHANVIDMDTNGNVYVAMSGGVYRLDKSTDEFKCISGDLFEANIGSQSCRFTNLVVSSDGSTIYLTKSVGISTVIGGLYKGIRNIDGTYEWSLLDNDGELWNAQAIAVHPENPDEIYLSMSVYDKNDIEDINSVILKENHGIYKSIDGGNSFSRLTEIKTGGSNNRKYHLINYLLFGTKGDDGKYPLYIAVNEKAHNVLVAYDEYTIFQPLTTADNQIGYENSWNSFGRKYYTGYYFTGLAIYPENTPLEGNVIFGSGPMIWDNDTKKVTRMAGGFNGHNAEDIVFDKDGRLVFCGVDVGMSFQDDNTPIYSGKTEELTFYYVGFEKTRKFIKAVVDPSDRNHIFGFCGKSNGSDDYYGIMEVNYNPDDPSESVYQMHTQVHKDNVSSFWNDEGGSPAKEIMNPLVMMYHPSDSNKIIESNYTGTCDETTGEWTWQKNDYFILAVSPYNPDVMIGGKLEGTYNANLMITKDAGETWEKLVSVGYRDAVCLPSTSPANAAWTEKRLVEKWEVIKNI